MCAGLREGGGGILGMGEVGGGDIGNGGGGGGHNDRYFSCSGILK